MPPLKAASAYVIYKLYMNLLLVFLNRYVNILIFTIIDLIICNYVSINVKYCLLVSYIFLPWFKNVIFIIIFVIIVELQFKYIC